MHLRNYHITRLLVLFFAVGCALGARGYDFVYNGLYFNIIKLDSQGNTISAPSSAAVAQYTTNATKYKGDIVIPSTAVYNGKSYAVTALEAGAFYQCDQLTSVVIPSSVTDLGNRTFAGCTSLKSVELAGGIASVGNQCFANCTALTSLDVPASVTLIDYRAFYKCTSLRHINLSPNVRMIGEQAFYQCSDLEDVVFPSKLTTISNSAFFSCTGLSDIELPQSVTTLGSNAFEGCSNVTSVYLPPGITTIPKRAFYQCVSLTYINWPRNLSTIGENAFYKCAGLTSLKLPASVTSLGGGAFSKCINLVNVELPHSVTMLPEELFSDCNLTYLKVGNNIRRIGANAITSTPIIEIATTTPPAVNAESFGVESLADIVVITPDAAAEEAYRKAEVWKQMCLTSADCNAEVTLTEAGTLAERLQSLTDLHPAEIVGLKVNGPLNAADFRTLRTGLPALTRLDLSGSPITSIPADAMAEKHGLQEVIFPESLVKIGNRAFANCRLLSGTLTLPPLVTTVGDYAFNHTGYTSLHPGEFLSRIGDYAFAGTYIANCPDFSEYGLKSIGYGAFEESRVGGHPVLPYGLQRIGGMAFYDCYLYNMTVHEPVATLEEGVLGRCIDMVSLSLPPSLEIIDHEALTECYSLANISLAATTPPEVYDINAFSGVDIDECALAIPAESLAEYLAAPVWYEFLDSRTGLQVVCEGSGEVTFQCGNGAKRADYGAHAFNGCALFPPQGRGVTLFLTPNDVEEIRSVTLNGTDISDQISDGVLTLGTITEGDVLAVTFSGEYSGIAAPITTAPTTTAPAPVPYYDLLGRPVANPSAPGLLITPRGTLHLTR